MVQRTSLPKTRPSQTRLSFFSPANPNESHAINSKAQRPHSPLLIEDADELEFASSQETEYPPAKRLRRNSAGTPSNSLLTPSVEFSSSQEYSLATDSQLTTGSEGEIHFAPSGTQDSASSQEHSAAIDSQQSYDSDEEAGPEQERKLEDNKWLTAVTDTLRSLSVPLNIQTQNLKHEFKQLKKQWGYANDYDISEEKGNCPLCGHHGLNLFFKIENSHNQNQLYVGSHDIKQFRAYDPQKGSYQKLNKEGSLRTIQAAIDNAKDDQKELYNARYSFIRK